MTKSKKPAVKKPSPFSGTLQIYQGTKLEQMVALRNAWSGCKKCQLGDVRAMESEANAAAGLTNGDVTDIVFGDGNPDADVIIVGEAPGELEVAHSTPFVGPSGWLLNRLLAETSADMEVKRRLKKYNMQRKHSDSSATEFSMDIFPWRQSEFMITNVVSCRPLENRTPIPPEISACWERLWNIIYIVDPLLIIACGNSALAAVARRKNAKITRERGNIHDVTYDGRLGTMTYPVMPVYHPAHLLRKGDWNTPNGDWSKTVEDFRAALTIVDQLRFRYYGTPIPNRWPI